MYKMYVHMYVYINICKHIYMLYLDEVGVGVTYKRWKVWRGPGCLAESIEHSTIIGLQLPAFKKYSCEERQWLGFLSYGLPSSESFVCGVYCECDVSEPFRGSKRESPPRVPRPGHCGSVLSSEHQRDSLGFQMTQSCFRFWEMKQSLPLEWRLWFYVAAFLRGEGKDLKVWSLRGLLSTLKTQPVLLIEWWNWFSKRIVFCSIQQSGPAIGKSVRFCEGLCAPRLNELIRVWESCKF